MTAGEALRAARLETEELRGLIHPVDPDRVRLVSAPSWLCRLWGRDVDAMTIWRWVLIRPEALQGDPNRLGRLVVHELVHVRQWHDYGPIGFSARYLRRYLSGLMRGLGHRQSYLANPYEVEAREVADGYGHIV